MIVLYSNLFPVPPFWKKEIEKKKQLTFWSMLRLLLITEYFMPHMHGRVRSEQQISISYMPSLGVMLNAHINGIACERLLALLPRHMHGSR